MNPQFDEVLLTAYLDNEVTDEERASVEEQLQSSEAARKLLEELRFVRNLVSQLHLSQPAGRFQKGPWNEPPLTEINDFSLSMGTPKVVLNETRWYQWMPIRRLASLAALIAVAVCSSVLLWGPNTQSVSLSKNMRPETASEPTAVPSRSLFEQSKTDDSQLTAENFVKLDSSTIQGMNRFKKEIYFEYHVNETDRQSGIASAEKPSDRPVVASLGKNYSLGVEKQRVEAEEGIETGAMLVEFQIPIENWDLGAKRLRKLGMDLPEKLPTVEYLEFTAIPITGTTGDALSNGVASEFSIDRFVVELKAAKDFVLSQWRFLKVAPLEKETLPEGGIATKEPAAKDKKENRPSSSTLRIRVRPIRRSPD